MIDKKEVTCIFCGNNKYDEIFSYNEPDKYEKAVGITSKDYLRKWILCTDCGLYYSIYSRSSDILDNIYVSQYRANNTEWRTQSTEEIFNKVIKLSANESETKKRVKWIKDNLALIWQGGITKKSTSPLNLLDIGGATGVFAYEFKDDVWESHVIDPSENSFFLKDKFNIEYKAEYYKPGIFNKKFDLISLNYVLEHLSNPISILELIKKDLTENSFIYIEVPDSLSFKYKDKDDEIFNSCHLWIFDPVTLVNILNKIGYQVYDLKREKTIRGHYIVKLIGGLK